MRKSIQLLLFFTLLTIYLPAGIAQPQGPEKSFSKKTLGRLLQNLQSSDLLFDQKPTRLNSQSKQIISNEEKHWEYTLNKTAPQELLVSEDQFVYRFVSALAISPNFADDQTLFAGVYNGGVFKSTDGGQSWRPVNSGVTTLRVTSLAISPSFATDHTVFVGSGDVLKSTNDGETWTRPSPSVSRVEDLALSPSFVDDQTVFAATDGMAVMKSTDGGNSWDQRIPGNSSQLWSVAMSPSYSTDSTVFAGALRGIYKSSNGGKSWIKTYDVYQVSCFGFSPTFAQDQTIFAGTLDGLLKSTDGGLSWAPALLESAAKILLSPDYANDQTLFVATAAGVFKSNDRGDTWEARNNGLTDFNVETLVLSPNYLNDHKMFAGTHEGVFKSSESDTEWKPINNGLLLTFGIENLTKSPYQLDTVPTIAVDSLGNVHVAWWGTYASSASPDGITTDAFYSRIVDETFERPLRIVVPTGYYSIDVSLAVDKDGYAHIAFRRGDFLRNDFKDDIYYATNKEGDFGSPIFVVEQESWGVDSPWDPFIAVDKDGGAHVAFDGLFKSQIFYTNNLAGFFTEPIVVPSPKFFLGGDPSLVIDNSGNAHIAYRGESETSIADIYYVNNVGGSFNNALNVSRREGGEDRPSLALDNLETPHIVYEGDFGFETFYTAMDADTFASPVRISDTGGRPSIAMDEAGFAHVSFGQGSHYANNLGGDFSDLAIATGLNRSNLNVGKPSISICRDNVVHVIFSMKSNFIETDFNWDIYHIAFTSSSNTGHIAYGSVLNLDGSIPDNTDITFQAYIVSRPTEVLTEKSAGCGYQNGVWSVQCASFPSQWQIGDTLQVRLSNITTGDTGLASGVLTNAREDNFGETVLGIPTQVEDRSESQLPTVYVLHQNYPNPFNPETTIKYQLPKASQITLEIYNILGHRVVTLVDKELPAGFYSIKWDGKDDFGKNVASGIYLYQLKTDEFAKVRKLTLLH